ncbi:MAG TPA: hypothetical protein VIV11_33765 [Kofleriaceae bacterium]
MRTALAAVLVVAACSNNLHHGIDAPPTDVSIDTFGPDTGDPPPNAVKLVVTRGGAPVVGVTTRFQNADSTLVHVSVTNDNGLAWTVMASGGFVTALERTSDGIDELTTFADVQEADALRLDLDPTGDTAQWPVVLGIPADNGAVAYQVYTTCGGPFGIDPAQPTETLLVGCGGVADVVVVGEDGNGTPVRGLYAADLVVPEPPPPQETDAMPPAYPPLTVAGTYGALVTKSLSYVNVPAIVSFVGAYHSFASSHGRVYERTAGDTPSGGATSVAIQLPAATAAALVATSLYSTDVGAQLIYDSLASGSSAAAYSLDVTAALLPPFATPPAYDATIRTVTWTERTGAQVPELVRTRIHAYRDAIPTGRAWGWRMIAPRTGTSVTFPQLPVFGFDFNPTSDDVVGVDELTTASVPGTYHDARPVGFTDLTSLVIGTTNRMVVQSLNALEP